MTDDELVAGIEAGDRRSLARAITLVESTRADHRARAVGLLERVLPRTGGAVRLGISGAPGVGKSTFIEAFGTHLTASGRTVAVLAVDPSSARSGGSILGDKTRMTELSRDPKAFIRPSPAGRSLGGVARRTREAMLLCEAAGFDVVLVETVGVGQSEIAVADMVDTFALLASPGGGDDLQGIKRGIMELADVLVVTKADGALLGPAQQAAADYRSALHLLRPRHRGWTVPILLCSAVKGEGIAEVWDAVEAHAAHLAASGSLQAQRGRQAKAWMWSEIRERLLDDLRDHPGVAAVLPAAEHDVERGTVTPATAASKVLHAYRSEIPEG